MRPELQLALFCVLILLASLAGGSLPAWLRLSHTRMQLLLSFVGGLMMGVALLHLLPHASVETGSVDMAAGAAVVGLLVMFFLIRLFHFHDHEVASIAEPHTGQVPAGTAPPPQEHAPGHSHPPAAKGSLPGPLCTGPALGGRRFSWIGLWVGLSLHTLIDGMALAASVAAESHEGHSIWPAGLGTFLAIALHKPLDAMSILSVMRAAGWSRRWSRLVNVIFAAMCPLGALAFFFGVQEYAETQHLLVGWALGFAAGVFLCIALADLLPELHFHSHDRLKLSAALLAGVAVAYGIGWLEPAHVHRHSHDEPAGVHRHEAP